MGSPGTTSAPSIIEFAVAALAIAAIGGIALVAKLIAALFHGIPIVGGWIDSHVESLAGAAFHTVQGWFLSALQPLEQEFDYVGATLATWISEVEDSLTNAHSATRSVSKSVQTLQHKTETASGASVQAELNALEDRIKGELAEIKSLVSELASIESYVHGPLRTAITTEIATAEADAKRFATTTVDTTITDITREVHRTIAGQKPVTLPVSIPADATLPAIISLTYAAVVTLEAEATECGIPMCSDWNAAKGLLRDLEGLVGVAVGAGLLVEAIENPIAAGVAIGKQATDIGNNALDIWKDLGLPT